MRTCFAYFFMIGNFSINGAGVSFLVKEAVAVELQEGKLATVPLKSQPVFLEVSIAYLKNQPLSPPARAFLKSLEKENALSGDGSPHGGNACRGNVMICL